jgi:glycosyltransferase involved in cell wall biosynthesis
MKLVVVIPAYNEEKTIGKVIREIPRKLNGIDKVEVIVVDDGSTDKTISEALKAGADRIVKHKMKMGLAVSFKDGLDAALEDGADVIVNTDADFQYNQKEIPNLVEPIIDGKADVVLSYRDVWKLPHMPLSKKIGNELTTQIVSFLAGFAVKDAQSGFRAYSREAVMRLNTLSGYTYVHDIIIQAVNKRLAIAQVRCEFKGREGKSRLIQNIFYYAMRAGSDIIRTYTIYRPLRFFLSVGALFSLLGLLVGMRVFIHFLTTGMVSPYIASAVLTAILLIVGFQLIMLGLIGNAINANMRINEECRYNLKKLRLSKSK